MRESRKPATGVVAVLLLALAAGGCRPAAPGHSDVDPARLQEAVARYESAVAWLLGADQAELQACWTEDREDFARRLAACADPACRSDVLRARLAELEGWQADHQRIDGLALVPPRQELLAVLAPEDGAAPPGLDRRPPQALDGVLVHAVADPEHMGLALAGSGGTHVVVFDAELGNQDGHGVLQELAGTRVPVRVHGHLATAPDGIDNFDTARCRRVYRLPASSPR